MEDLCALLLETYGKSLLRECEWDIKFTDWPDMTELDVVFPIEPEYRTKWVCGFKLRVPPAKPCFEQSITIVLKVK
jgi:hypothetical protein